MGYYRLGLCGYPYCHNSICVGRLGPKSNTLNMKIKVINWHPVVVKVIGDLTPLIKVKKAKPKRYKLVRFYRVEPVVGIRVVLL